MENNTHLGSNVGSPGGVGLLPKLLAKSKTSVSVPGQSKFRRVHVRPQEFQTIISKMLRLK